MESVWQFILATESLHRVKITVNSGLNPRYLGERARVFHVRFPRYVDLSNNGYAWWRPMLFRFRMKYLISLCLSDRRTRVEYLA